MAVDAKIDTKVLEEKISDLSGKIDLVSLKNELAPLELQSGQPDLWQDEDKAKQIMSKIAEIKDTIETFERLSLDLQNLNDLINMAKEQADDSLDQEINILGLGLVKKIEQFELVTYLSGKYDSSEAIFSIHSGQGGTEAMDWAQMLSRMYTRYFEKRGWSHELVEYSAGEEAGIKSATYLVHGRYAFGYLKNEKGTHRLVRQSPFNADKLRQTSFAGVEIIPVLPDQVEIEIKDEDLEFEASRSSGAGGQNVNKVNTAVRIKHIPTGIVVECQTQRYQVQNRKIAMQILKGKLWEIQEAKRQEELSQIKGNKTMASWGTQIRNYVLHPYKLVKDTRTEHESSNPDSILDGNLDEFIESELKFFAQV